jgi:hypothetical protein
MLQFSVYARRDKNHEKEYLGINLFALRKVFVQHRAGFLDLFSATTRTG